MRAGRQNLIVCAVVVLVIDQTLIRIKIPDSTHTHMCVFVCQPLNIYRYSRANIIFIQHVVYI